MGFGWVGSVDSRFYRLSSRLAIGRVLLASPDSAQLRRVMDSEAMSGLPRLVRGGIKFHIQPCISDRDAGLGGWEFLRRYQDRALVVLEIIHRYRYRDPDASARARCEIFLWGGRFPTNPTAFLQIPSTTWHFVSGSEAGARCGVLPLKR